MVFSSAIFDSTDSDFLEKAELLAIVSSHYGRLIIIFFEMIQGRELKSRNIKDLFFTLTHFHGCKTTLC